MRKLNICIIILSFICYYNKTFSQTTVSGGNVSGTWTLAGSPYLINGSIQIPNGQTLTIEPGVTVNFQGHYKFYVQGRVLAIGTISDTITFTASDTTTGWKGIRFDNTPTTNDSSKFVYCKVQYGKASGSGEDVKGGAFYFYFSKALISNCLISNNFSQTSNGAGAGIYCYFSNPTISNNIIKKNVSDTYGGGIYSRGNISPIITNNVIINNFADDYGGGIYCEYNSEAKVINNNIGKNYSSHGGGLYCEMSTPKIANNTFSENSSDWGGAIFSYSSSAIIANNIINNNYAEYDGGGIICCCGSSLIVNNNSLYNNFANHGGAIYCYSNIQGGSSAFELNGNFYTGTYQNNLDSDPLFTSPTTESGTSYDGTTADWSLQDSSPCINAGTPDTTGLNLPSIDIAGNPRVSNGRIDIGAYENLGTSISNSIINNSINIYPNPNNGNFLLFIENNESKNFDLQIYDITGQIIFSKNYENKTVLAENIDISQFGSGVYSINISCGSESFHKNIVVLK